MKIKRNKAPLVVPDINDLGDKRLSPAEGHAKIKAENDALAQQRRIHDPDQFGNFNAALGRPLRTGDFISRLQRMNPMILIHPGGFPNSVAVRYPGMEYASGFPLGIMGADIIPEYTTVIYDDRGVDSHTIRGWREVILKLIERGALTLENCDKEFGKAVGFRSTEWLRAAQEATQKFKQRSN